MPIGERWYWGVSGGSRSTVKFFAWDKTVGSLAGCAGEVGRTLAGCETFRTDALDANQWWVVIAVVGFYFLASFRK